MKAHELGLDEPRYRMSVSGPEYAQEFTAKATIGPKDDIIGKGTGTSKRKAQLAAAEMPGMSSTGTRPRSRRPARTARPSTGAAARPATDQLVNGDCAMLSPVCLN
ncbi:hypothetical protein BBJK_01964 [Bifidobacterium bifidum LMG 13195]|uniref:DRBM domain-containing protein n=1 Tax=Bifidobacterium bifidum LMG 13195 TaxID=1207542 RepID=A0A286TD94_BIFBI|nr:hypothetical protein BBJK_01964 [Bifidobacterium bifidum LMG 13195]